jgi:polyisoprenoid-binding protein YceI
MGLAAETGMSKSVAKLWLAALLLAGTGFAQEAERTYSVDPAASDVHWLVYKAGALARLGHNHTIAVGDLRGTVRTNAADVAASQFELEFNVASLVVDDPALRKTLGADFESVPSAKDIEGTKGNMLGDRVLSGDKFPKIRIVGNGPVARDGAQVLTVKVELLGRTVDLTVPTQVTIDDQLVKATGEFELNHADLGMKPFSVMAGALQVGEKLSFSYSVTARRDAR